MTAVNEREELNFKAEIEIIGINPFVFVPDNILIVLFEHSGRSKGPIPIKGTINGKPYQQNLVRYQGAWRLYINITMLAKSPKRIGEIIEVSIAFDPVDRTVVPHPKLLQALSTNEQAKAAFDSLVPSLQNEIVRYISHLKTEESVTKNVQKAIDFLTGKGRFIGRDPIKIR
jgi:hypothetical protein